MEEPTAQVQQMKPSPNRKIKSIIIGIVILVIIVIVLVLTLSSNNPAPSSKSNTSSATVVITAQGFEPNTLKINVGTKVTWHNTDTALHQIASNPYPANNGLPGLLSKGLEPGQSYSYTFKQSGKFGYHDQEHPTSLLGVVNVGE